MFYATQQHSLMKYSLKNYYSLEKKIHDQAVFRKLPAVTTYVWILCHKNKFDNFISSYLRFREKRLSSKIEAAYQWFNAWVSHAHIH